MSRKRKYKIFGVSLIAIAVIALFFGASLTGNVVAVYNGKSITLQELNKEYSLFFAINDIPKSYESVISKPSYLNQTIIENIIYDNALKGGISINDNDAESVLKNMLIYENKTLSSFSDSLKSNGLTYNDAVNFIKKQLIINSFLNQTLFNDLSVNDSEAEDYYNSHKSYFNIGKQIRVSHILVNSSEEAEKIIKKLDNGANFTKLAINYSIGPSAKLGGDLGYIQEGQTLKDFENAAFSLKEVGDYTHTPVKTSYGYHIIMLTGIKPAHNYTFSEVKDEIKKRLLSLKQQTIINNYIKQLLSNSKITIYLESSNNNQETTNIPKSSKPSVELFVMSYCPFGTQAEKGIIPALKTLGNNIDFKLRFVYYSMHGWKELQENLRQYCIQKEHPEKLLDYLTCFLNNSDSPSCLDSLNLNVSNCMSSADREFNITNLYNDKSTWLSGYYPLCNIDASLNHKYNVGGSPTLVINGIKATPSSRSPAAYLSIICSAFTNKPSACNNKLSSQAYSSGFGYSTGASGGSCN